MAAATLLGCKETAEKVLEERHEDVEATTETGAMEGQDEVRRAAKPGVDGIGLFRRKFRAGGRCEACERVNDPFDGPLRDKPML